MEDNLRADFHVSTGMSPYLHGTDLWRFKVWNYYYRLKVEFINEVTHKGYSTLRNPLKSSFDIPSRVIGLVSDEPSTSEPGAGGNLKAAEKTSFCSKCSLGTWKRVSSTLSPNVGINHDDSKSSGSYLKDNERQKIFLVSKGWELSYGCLLSHV